MSKTRGMILDRCAALLGDDSTDMRDYLAESLNDVLYEFWDEHDWSFKHKTGTFTTVAATETYSLRTGSPDIRSTQDVEMMYDKTNGIKLFRTETRDIRRAYPKEDSTGKPTVYSAWNNTEVQLTPVPDGAYIIHFPYIANPTLPTDDADDLLAVCGIPVHLHSLVEKLTLLAAFTYYDDNRASSLYNMIYGTPGSRAGLLPRAINSDARYLDNQARFKFWEEELSSGGDLTYDRYLANVWAED